MPVMGPDIYAAGDAVQVKHYVTGNDTLEDMDKISKDKNAVLLDVRTVGKFSRGHINGLKNIPVDELRERINEVEKACLSDMHILQELRIHSDSN